MADGFFLASNCVVNQERRCLLGTADHPAGPSGPFTLL